MASIDDRWTTVGPEGKRVRTERWGTGKRYRARWRESPNAPQKYKPFERKVDAERFLIGVAHDQLTGRYVDPALGKTTFDEVAKRYLARGAWRDRSRETATERLAGARAEFGGRAVATIKRGEIQSFISGLKLAPSTVKVVHQHIAAAFETAIDDGLIAVNPARKVKLPRTEGAPVEPIAQAELDSLLAVAPAWFRVTLVLGGGLGLRLGEAAGLTVDRVDFLRKTVRIDRQWQQPSGARPGAFAPPKTEASSRTIPASAEVIAQLAAHLAEHPAGGLERFIVHRDGKPVAAPQWEYAMRTARTKAKVRDEVTFHDLRHFYASALISAGCSVKAVQSALGHRSAAMTLDVYGHLWPGDDDRIRAALDGVFAAR